MNRKEFLKKSAVVGALGAIMPQVLAKSHPTKSTYDELMKTVGFNHLPHKEIKSMNTVLHKAESRGHANHGWLDSHHTFSFANYHNPERMHFGVLRVLNDDRVAGGQGFGTHPHNDMEIISIPLEGDLEHQDNMGNKTVIKEGDVQVMSAGTGVYHSEYNKNSEQEVKFLQIWLFPREKGVKPRYDQISTADLKKHNAFYQILSPNQADDGVWIHQDAWFHLGEFEAGKSAEYTLKDKRNGLYVFMIGGEAEVANEHLSQRDGFGIWDSESVSFKSKTKSKILLMEVPLQLNK